MKTRLAYTYKIEKGNQHAATGKYKKALADYHDAINIDHSHYLAHALIGGIFETHYNNVTIALPHYQKALQLLEAALVSNSRKRHNDPDLSKKMVSERNLLLDKIKNLTKILSRLKSAVLDYELLYENKAKNKSEKNSLAKTPDASNTEYQGSHSSDNISSQTNSIIRLFGLFETANTITTHDHTKTSGSEKSYSR